jgi:FkbM family methyltransferase
MSHLSKRTRLLNIIRTAFMNHPGELVLIWAMQVVFLRPLAFRLLPNHYQYQKASFRTVVRHGIRFELDISNLNDWEVYYFCTDDSLEVLVSACSPGDRFLDIGANIGFATLRAAQQIGENGCVYSLEPYPDTFSKLKRNLQLNLPPNVHAYPVALGAVAADARLVVVKADNLGRNKISSQPKTLGVPVSLVTLDSFCKNQDIDRIDIMKLDVEGYEAEVLKGGREVIRRWRPKMLIEIGDENLRAQGSSPAEIISMLLNFGYKIKDARSNKDVDLSQNFANCHFDAWCHT